MWEAMYLIKQLKLEDWNYRLELVSSLYHWAKNKLKMFLIQNTSIWSTFTLIVLRIQKKKA